MTSTRPARLSLFAKARLAGEVATTYVRARRLMHRTDIRSAVARMREGADANAGPAVLSPDEGLRLGRAVARTLGVLPADSRCLIRSLVLCGLLARRGATGTLVVGVRPGEQFGAHAWVELDGRPLLAPGADQFARLVEL